MPTRYVQWLANIVPIVKKNGELRACVDFRDLNITTPKDMNVVAIANMIINYIVNNNLFSFMDDLSSYNQILITVEDKSKNSFRCPNVLAP